MTFKKHPEVVVTQKLGNIFAERGVQHGAVVLSVLHTKNNGSAVLRGKDFHDIEWEMIGERGDSTVSASIPTRHERSIDWIRDCAKSPNATSCGSAVICQDQSFCSSIMNLSKNTKVNTSYRGTDRSTKDHGVCRGTSA